MWEKYQSEDGKTHQIGPFVSEYENRTMRSLALVLAYKTALVLQKYKIEDRFLYSFRLFSNERCLVEIRRVSTFLQKQIPKASYCLKELS